MKNWTITYDGKTVTAEKKPDQPLTFFVHDALALLGFKPVSREWACDIMTRDAVIVSRAGVEAVACISCLLSRVDII